MRILSWNVNGLRSAAKKGNVLNHERVVVADVICLQEIRCDDACANKILYSVFESTHPYRDYHTSTTKKGYSGVAVISKLPFMSVDKPIIADNLEGRVILVEYAEFAVVNVYTPNSGTERLEYRTTQWDPAFLAYVNIKRETLGKPVIVCGDMNVAHHTLDVHNPTGRTSTMAGFTLPERTQFGMLLRELDYVDVFRHQNPTVRKYTWWSNMRKDRMDRDGHGWRIDYFLVPRNLLSRVEGCEIDTYVWGSDHAPLWMGLDFKI